jgi:hypothetical protein
MEKDKDPSDTLSVILCGRINSAGYKQGTIMQSSNPTYPWRFDEMRDPDLNALYSGKYWSGLIDG